MNRSIIIFLLLCCVRQQPARCQAPVRLKWWSPPDSAGYRPGGLGWPPDNGVAYTRLPLRAARTVRGEIMDLARDNAGLSIDFRTNATSITIEYGVIRPLQMPHMPATGVSGIDLYCRGKKGQWLRAAGNYQFGDTIRYRFSQDNNGPRAVARNWRLYLPLYNAVSRIRIGVDSNAYFSTLPPSPGKPIIVYGTSIAQGACASRPGLAWPALLGRKLDRSVINLGFSGNGRLEPAVIDLINESDAALIILDCLPNLSNMPPAQLQEKIVAAVQQVRQRHPLLPLLLAEHPGFGDEALNAGHRRQTAVINGTLQQAVAQLRQSGVKNIYVLTKTAIGLNPDCFVDQIHPNDAGMLRYAHAYAEAIKKIL